MDGKIYKNVLIRDQRIIRRKSQAPGKCHHLQIILRICQTRNPFAGDRSLIIGQMILELPKFNYLELELSLEKSADGRYRCTQCKEGFDLREYRSYRSLFEKAKRCRYPVWKIKELYREQRRKRMMSGLLMEIIPGRQKYVCEVSRLTAVGIMERKDVEKLYDELMERFL